METASGRGCSLANGRGFRFRPYFCRAPVRPTLPASRETAMDILPKMIRIAPNNPVFDLPVIVGIEEGLFAAAGLDVAFCASYDAREKDSAENPVLSRLKESLFEKGAADSYNVCEW